MTRELIERARGGDRDAFGEVARLYAPLVTGALLARLGRFQEAEDLVQETFVRALQQIGTLRDPDRVGAWLFGIAVNVSREHLRARARAEAAPAALAAAGGARSADDAPAVDAEGLQACLERLPDALREIFILRHIQGMSYRELAGLRDATVTSVGERLWKARRLLRDCLERRGAAGAGLAEGRS
jgi:RNA polymerase sigma-70 factor (ECF subfamily)